MRTGMIAGARASDVAACCESSLIDSQHAQAARALRMIASRWKGDADTARRRQAAAENAVARARSSEAELGFQEIVDGLRVRLAAG